MEMTYRTKKKKTLRTTNHSFILFLLEEGETKASFGLKTKGYCFLSCLLII
jgi:hypothetical protein